jgi:ABC-2 type transport system permease protein
MNRMLLLIRREFWEHRAFLIAPIVVAALLVVIALTPHAPVGDLNLDEVLREKDLMGHHLKIMSVALSVLAGFFFVVMCVVSIFYLLDSLHSDRKDRSVLFWKSLPVSDTSTVLSKLLTAAVAIPLWTWVAALAGTILFALVFNTRLSFMTSVNLWPVIWDPRAWLNAYALWFYAMVAGVLWYLPIMGWLLLVSSWAKRAVMLWAALPPVMLMFMEWMLFDTSYVASTMGYRFLGWTDVAFKSPMVVGGRITVEGEELPWPASAMDLINAGGYFSNPDLWIGIVVAAAFVWGAILIRRHRTDI